MAQIGDVKPMKMFVYQPLFLAEKQEGPGRPKADKFVLSIISKYPFCRIEVGDVFTAEKRPDNYHLLLQQEESKVVAVRYNFVEKACIIILEGKKFDSMEKLNRFASGKKSINAEDNPG